MRVVELVEFAGPGCEARLGAAQHDDRRRLGEFVERHQQAAVPVRVAFDRRARGAQRRLGRIEVTGFAEQVAEPHEHAHGEPVARRRSVVRVGLRPHDQRLRVVGGEEEAAGIGVDEAGEHQFSQFDGPVQRGRLPARLEQLEQSPRERGVVVQVGGEPRLAFRVDREQSTVAPAAFAQEPHRAECGVGILVAAERTARTREAADRETVPGRQDLLVAARPDPRIAHPEQRAAALVEPRLDHRFTEREVGAEVADGAAHVQVPLALEIGLLVQPETPREHFVLLGLEVPLHLVGRPDVELAFVALRVRIERRVEATVGRAQVAQHPVGRFLGGPAEQRLACRDCRLRIDAEQLPVVVQHLLEVRDHPVGVDRVAVETAAELVVEAALGHARQRQRGHVQRLQVRFVAGGRRAPGPQQQLDVCRMRELGRIAETAEACVEFTLQRRARHG